ncbi:MAG: YeeE/YedE thiosulfate transporter family protein [Planctomycetaceae bacterium]
MFDPAWKLILGLVTGIVFGVLLQKGRVSKYEVIVGQFLGRDFSVVKIMGTAVVVGALGIYALLPSGTVALHLKSLVWAGLLVGGTLFGIGMAVLGYCPGTGVAACGEGRSDAWSGLAGMLTGAAVYVIFYPTMSKLAGSLGDGGEKTLPELTGTSPWLWIIGIIILAAVALVLTKRSSHDSTSSSES